MWSLIYGFLRGAGLGEGALLLRMLSLGKVVLVRVKDLQISLLNAGHNRCWFWFIWSFYIILVLLSFMIRCLNVFCFYFAKIKLFMNNCIYIYLFIFFIFSVRPYFLSDFILFVRVFCSLFFCQGASCIFLLRAEFF